MAPNFFTKLVKPSAAQTTNGGAPRDDGISDSHSQLSSPSVYLLPRTSSDGASDTLSHSSVGSFKIGVVPPSPRPASNSGFNDLTMPSAHTNDTHVQAHKRTRSNDRQIPDRHAISLAAYTMNVNTERSMGEDTLTTPTPNRYNTRPNNSGFPMPESSSPSKSPRQLSPASSTGNLKGLIDKHASRRETSPDVPVQAVRSRPQPLDQALNKGREVGDRQDDPHEDGGSGLVESPTATATFLSDGDVTSLKSAKSSSGSKKKKKSGPGWRRPSVTTPSRKQTGIASAIAASGLAMANATSSVPALPALPPLPQTSKTITSQNGTKAAEGMTPSADRTKLIASSSVQSMPGTVAVSDRQLSLSRSDVSDRHYQTESSGSSDGSESDDELEAEIPVTGFAVASNKRNTDFHELFSSIPDGDYLIEGAHHHFYHAHIVRVTATTDYGCALQREILIQGRIYISENHICFHANIFGWITDVCLLHSSYCVD